jgi:hypothetical protein
MARIARGARSGGRLFAFPVPYSGSKRRYSVRAGSTAQQPRCDKRIARGLVVYSKAAEGTPLAFLVEAASVLKEATLIPFPS